ncbi:hypothetical protein FKM82_013674 [Ascaphus truei]
MTIFPSHFLLLFAITETWLTQSDSALEAALSYGGLSFSHTPRPHGRGGGVGLLLSSLCRYRTLPIPPSLAFHSFEAHCPDLLSSPCPCGGHLSPTYLYSSPFCLSLSL